MASLIERLFSPGPTAESRYNPFVDGLKFSYNGIGYDAGFMAGSAPENVAQNFDGYIGSIHRRHGVVASVVANRAYLMSEVVFVFRDADGRINGAPDILNNPSVGVTRPHMLSLAEQHISYAGNAYFWRRRDNTIQLCPPHLVKLIYGSADQAEPETIAATGDLGGYLFYRDGLSRPPVLITPDKMGHWIQEPSPDRRYMGESWVTSVLREIQNDGQATDHISKFFERSAVPSLIFSPKEALTVEQMTELQEYIQRTYGGAENAYKAFIVGGGSDVTVVGSKIGDLAMAELQGGHETRIMMRGMVHPVIVGAREGMQGASLNAGNYQQIRRQLSDKWFSPATNQLIASVEHLVRKPDIDGSLGFDPSRIQFLQDDRMDEAKIKSTTASGMRQLVDGGWDPDSVTKWAQTGNFADLEHTGLPSVQVQPPEALNAAPEPEGGPDDDE